MTSININKEKFGQLIHKEKPVLVDSGATIESIAFPFRYKTSVGIISIFSASAICGSSSIFTFPAIRISLYSSLINS